MTDLQINLKQILQEKNEKIIPENIKQGVTIFGVTGTYVGDTPSPQADSISESSK